MKNSEIFIKEETPLISVVVLNWNDIQTIEKYLNSLYEQKYKPLEILVVGNGSIDGSPDLIRKNFPEVKLIINEKNFRFGGGNNIGIRASNGKYIMMLNNDIRLDPIFIEDLKSSIEKGNRDGAIYDTIGGWT